jgi:hypothetical protein
MLTAHTSRLAPRSALNTNQARRGRRNGRARAYRFRLIGSADWYVFVARVRNRGEAETMLRAKFGDSLAAVRVHPVSDPWPKTQVRPRAARLAADRYME